MILLHAFRPEPEHADRQARTRAFLDAADPELRASGWAIIHLPTPVDDPQAYERGFREAWGRGEDLIVLEGDKVPTLAMLRALEACPRELCAQAYRVYPVTTGLKEPVWVHRRAPHGAWIDEGETEAAWVGFGLVRFRSTAMRRNPAEWEPGIWNGLDARVSRYLHDRGESWCVHWPACEHDHR